MVRAAVRAPWPAETPSSRVRVNRGPLRGVASPPPPAMGMLAVGIERGSGVRAAADGLATATAVLHMGHTPCLRSHSSTQLLVSLWAGRAFVRENKAMHGVAA